MKNKILKISVAIVVLITLTMTNFIFVGASFLSYAASNLQTNHQNIEFDAYLKDENGNKQTTIEKTFGGEDNIYLQLSVKKEGYFNGNISLENSNFRLKSSDNEYVNKIEGNTITLNQINAGATIEIPVKIEPIKEDRYDIGLLNIVSKINLNGIYRDSTQKDINIKSSRNINLKMTENNTGESVLNDINVITNKITKVSGEEKRVLQLSLNLGIKDNNYPMKEIISKLDIKNVENATPEIVKVDNLNNMTSSEYKNENSSIEIKLKNDVAQDNKVMWKSQGSENIIVTYIYNKDAKLEKAKVSASEKVTLYNQKVMTSEKEFSLDNQEKDEIIQVNSINSENEMYKGKIYSGIDRQFRSNTKLNVNLANVAEYINIHEKASTYNVNNTDANIIYNKTILKKEQFDKIFGQSGVIDFINEKGEIVATINNSTSMDEEGNIVIDYTGKEPKELQIKTTTPISEGIIEFNHIKTIRPSDKEVIKVASEINSNIEYSYNMYEDEKKAEIGKYAKGIQKEISTKIILNNTKTEARLEINKDSLSTVIENNVEMKAILKSNSEQNDLYKNPVIKIQLPEEVEKVDINSIDLLYENELKVKEYNVNGKVLTITLEGEQTQYKQSAIEGATLVINLNLTINKKAASREAQINMEYSNENAVSYNEGNIGTTSQGIKIVAPKDVTTINSIKDLSVETIGQEEIRKVTIPRGDKAKQLETSIEVINNNTESIENVRIIGTFPTRNNENNIDTKIIQPLSVENAKIYYTENENATDDLQNVENAWLESILDNAKVRKYLIVIDKIEARSSIQGTYKFELPENLEYNQQAKQGYSVKYINSLTKVESNINSSLIELQTGIGPKVDTKLIATRSGVELKSGDTVRNGEVIRYKVQVSNIGTEDITNVQVSGQVPEGTTLVVPEPNYEYTGSSYYKELPDKTYESNIETLKVGEVITKEYEVRVNKGIAAGTQLSNIIQIKYGDVVKETNKIQLKTQIGNIRVSVKRVTDRNIDLYTAGTVQYFAIIENISNEKQDNVTVKTNISNNLKVNKLIKFKGMPSEEVSDDDIYITGNEALQKELPSNQEQNNVTSEELAYSEEVNIGTIEPGEAIVLSYEMIINKTDNDDKINFSVTVKHNDEEYNSNNWEDNVESFNIKLSMDTNIKEQYIKSGDVLEYIINIENTSNSKTSGLIIKDNIPAQLTVNKVTINDEVIQGINGNNLEIPYELEANGKAILKIETAVNYSEARKEAEAITNVATAEVYGKKIATTQEINHIIQANQSEDPNENDDNNVDDNDIAQGTKMITGLAWFDENANGIKDEGEKTLNNIKVRLLNIDTNNLVKDKDGKILESVTNENGIYVLDKIGNGKYVAIFDYDNSQYKLTKYKVEGVNESNNSDVLENELTIEGKKQQVASTDIIQIDNNNISNINIGLVKLQNFDLKLDKYVSKILIQNRAGTTVKEYNNETLAKAEIDAKQINGTTVIIEYKIDVTNNGEVEGYAKKIADYIPADLKFSSELNKEWYQSGDTLYTSSIANDKIKSGETKTLKLTLTKSMTENNTGLVNNTAEIAESYNDLGLEDSNSTPGNRAKGENDMGSADVMLSIRTGGFVYITATIITLVILGAVAFVITKKTNKTNKKEI